VLEPVAAWARVETAAEAAVVTEAVGAAADFVAVATCAVSAAVDGARVAACACRENASKTARIPTAKIATCTARQAMCRKIGWDI
jgi:hypothetical protein